MGILMPLCACAAEQPAPRSTSPAAAPVRTLVVYAGRTEQQIGPILSQLEQAVRVKLDVRYGETGKLAEQLIAEGQDSPADLFLSQDAGTLGLLESKGLLAELPDELRQAVPGAYRSVSGHWVGTSARARVIAYDPKQVAEPDIPRGTDDLVQRRWRGKIGYVPGNPSWLAFVTALRVLRGEEDARRWLLGFKANNPRRYQAQRPLLDAVDRGEVPLGLINHYAWYEKSAEVGVAKMRARLHHVTGADPAALVNIAGAGVLRGGEVTAARQAVEFLLSTPAQQFFADHLAEYPVRQGISSTKHQLPPLKELKGPGLNLNRLVSVQDSTKLLTELGLS
ncbi:ABC transporter substrate-binding protein [Crossiella sp. SN42]|uniref:extracellular solute-binding protein n=1 Tax=Crossiella sp. SN42 TaxID=2944808 RepID=UPI00207CF791|nr:extracellular solute-binding protein [Crossiella sp. SN42]MCO1579579.1 ABC transporter substrate-binding protein [Crossiella sp. SN42]